MKRYMKTILGGMTVVSVVPIATAAVSCSSKSDSTSSDPDRNEAIEDLIIPFPVLESYAYYPYIRVNGSGAYISDEMISKAVTNIVKGLTTISKDVSWGYHRDNGDVYIKFMLMKQNGEPKTKTYKLKLI